MKFNCNKVFSLGVLVAASSVAFAQGVSPYSGALPGDSKLPEPHFDEAPVAPLLLPAEPAPENGRLSTRPLVQINEVVFEGNTVLTDNELVLLAKPYLGRVISNAELQELRHSLTMAYVKRGYINSGVIIPDQKLSGGTLRLKVVEGMLTTITVDGNEKLDSDYISQRLELEKGEPLNINALQEKLQLLQQNPRIKRVNAKLAPATKRGDAILRTNIEEERPYDVYITANNHHSPSIGAERLQVEGIHRNLTGRGDSLTARYGITSGLDDFSVSYELPLNANDTTLGLRYEQSDSIVIEEPFSLIDIESESETFSISLKHPLYKSLTEEFSLGLAVEKRSSKSTLLGNPFSFSPAAENGETRVSVLRFSQNWTRKNRNQVFAARSSFSFGFDAWDATTDDNNPDGRFAAWLGQVQWANRFGSNHNQLIARANVQLAEDQLLPLEKFAVGGANSVRGYRENQLVRDNGIVASLEMRIPVLHDENGKSNLQLAPFVDMGYSWDKGQRNEAVDIASVGLGLRWQPQRQLNAELYVAHAFSNFDNTDHDLQDSGIHFSMTYSFF